MRNKLIYMMIFAAFLAASCKKYLAVNDPNPNNPVSVTPDLLLPGALNKTVNMMTATSDGANLSFDFLGWWMGYWCVSGTYVPATIDLQYAEPNTYKQELWANLYRNINDYKNLENAGVVSAQPFYTGIAKIMEAYDFQTLVDLWGNVPYSQALRGTNLLLPKYDDAQTIYNSLLKQIDTGIVLIKSDMVTTAGGNDIMFGGDHGKWVRFANTVKLRILIRQSQVPGIQTLVTAELGTVGSDGYLMPKEGAYVNPGFQNSTGKSNPFWEQYGYNVSLATTGSNQYYKAATYGITFYQNTKDSRIGYFYAPSAVKSTKYLGGVFGDTGVPGESGIGGNGSDGGATIQDPTLPTPSGLLQGSSSDAVLISSFESQFLQSEAAYRGWISGDPQALYNEAITESFEYLIIKSLKDQKLVKYADSSANAYYSQPINNVNYAISTNKLQAIITQKWAALNGISMLEAYDDFRRTGFPNDLPQSAQANHPFPRRLLYPQTEQSTNAANVPATPAKIFWVTQ